MNAKFVSNKVLSIAVIVSWISSLQSTGFFTLKYVFFLNFAVTALDKGIYQKKLHLQIDSVKPSKISADYRLSWDGTTSSWCSVTSCCYSTKQFTALVLYVERLLQLIGEFYILNWSCTGIRFSISHKHWLVMVSGIYIKI